MTKLTKLALEQINTRLAAENEQLRKEVADLRLLATMQHTPTQRVARHMPQWQIDRQQAMNAAREMAMRCGAVVKV
jgi:hypothetical protein